MTWVLVLYIYAGAFAKGDSVAMTTVAGFRAEADCQIAGKAAASLVSGSVKELRFVCLRNQ